MDVSESVCLFGDVSANACVSQYWAGRYPSATIAIAILGDGCRWLRMATANLLAAQHPIDGTPAWGGYHFLRIEFTNAALVVPFRLYLISHSCGLNGRGHILRIE